MAAQSRPTPVHVSGFVVPTGPLLAVLSVLLIVAFLVSAIAFDPPNVRANARSSRSSEWS